MDPRARWARYAKVSTQLVHLDDDALGRLLTDRQHTRGWGHTQLVEVAGDLVFVKMIPLTDLEHGRTFSTKNHYRLPMCYQYCVGSAGFGAWRELVTHITTTNWVLSGVVDSFPLTYHVRLVNRPEWVNLSGPPDVDDYVRGWNSSASVARYITERATGSYAALVFVEQVPYAVWDWLTARPADTELIIRQLSATLSVMHDQGVVHFDAHFSNAMTDGEQACLVDFGLACDSRFDLTKRERAFLERHFLYDYGVLLFSLGGQLARWYEALGGAQQEAIREHLGVPDDRNVVRPALVRGVEDLADVLHPDAVDAVVRYRDVIEFMDGFFSRLQANRRKNTPYDDAELRRLLQAAHIIDR